MDCKLTQVFCSSGLEFIDLTKSSPCSAYWPSVRELEATDKLSDTRDAFKMNFRYVLRIHATNIWAKHRNLNFSAEFPIEANASLGNGAR